MTSVHGPNKNSADLNVDVWTLNELPEDALTRIFLELTRRDIPRLRSINKEWKEKITKENPHLMVASMRKLVNGLLCALPKETFSTSQEMLIEMGHKLDQKFSSLEELKGCIANLSRQFSEILGDFDYKILAEMKANTPLLKCVELALKRAIREKLQQIGNGINDIQDAATKEDAYKRHISLLIEAQEFLQAGLIAALCFNEEDQIATFIKIFAAAMESESFDEALNMVNVFRRSIVADAHAQVADAFLKIGAFAKAADAADQISDTEVKQAIIKTIFQAALSAQKLEEATLVVWKMKISEERGIAFGELIQAFAKADNFPKAVHLAERIIDSKNREAAIETIVAIALESKKWDETIAITHLFLDESAKKLALEIVARAQTNAS